MWVDIMYNNSKNQKINKLLFLTETPFTKRDYERFGFELLKKNGFKVEVCDLTNILNLRLIKKYTPPDPTELSYRTVFNNKYQGINKIKNLFSNTFIFSFVGYSPKSFWVYKAISASDADYAVLMSDSLPSATNSEKKGFFYYIKNIQKASPEELTNFVRRFYYRVPFSFFGMKPASLILAGGEQYFNSQYPVDKTTEVLWAHGLDYDTYLKEREIPFIECPMAVFLDEYLPFHPDFLINKVHPPINADNYYPLLNKFFTRIEKELELEVIIAAHPKSCYEKHHDYFEGRKCIRGETPRLIKESQLVLVHSSTSVNLANLFYKPVIFMTSHTIAKSGSGPLIGGMADWFGKKPVFIDDDVAINWKQQMTINASNYDRYRQAFIKTKWSEDVLFWQIVANRLKKWR